ncbi:MAG TPA: DUF58 domain-containing protein, partial [Pilimelia sp.]|nr:DUF58 domain-containing protein [Pilimelia sp.]
AGLGLRFPELAAWGSVMLAACAAGALRCLLRPRLRVERTVRPDRVERGAACTVTLRLTNTSRWRAATLAAADHCGGQPAPVAVRGLRPRATTDITYPVPTGRRGVVLVGPLRVCRRDWWDLVSADADLGGRAVVRVRPRRYPLGEVPPGGTRSLDGRRDRVPHGAITFDTLRGYAPGDDLRRVHWRASARAGELLVREHADTSMPHLVVVLDDRASAYPDDDVFETACEVAASVLAAAGGAGLPATLRLSRGAGVDSGPRRPAAVDACLDLLAEAATGPDAPLDPVLAAVRGLPYGDTLLFVTGVAGRADARRVARLRGRYPAVRCVVCGDRSGMPPAPGLLVVRDGADFAARWPAVRW